jgi:hypothetical protein
MASESELDSVRGWVVVAAAFLSTFVVFGIVYSFGAFFDSMAEDFGTGKGATALMFSITTAWYFGLGLVSGRVADSPTASDRDRSSSLPPACSRSPSWPRHACSRSGSAT